MSDDGDELVISAPVTVDELMPRISEILTRYPGPLTRGDFALIALEALGVSVLDGGAVGPNGESDSLWLDHVEGPALLFAHRDGDRRTWQVNAGF